MSAALALPPRVATQAATLAVEGLSVTYPVAGGALAAVRDVSFAIAPGEAFGLIGESGSGKSTIAYSVMRYLRGATAAGRANFRAPTTQRMTATVTATIMAVTGSCSSVAASTRPKNGCRSCSWPTVAMPPCDSPRYQKMKPISMLNSDT